MTLCTWPLEAADTLAPNKDYGGTLPSLAPQPMLQPHCRRLNAKGHGAPLLVDDELPASVDRVVQDDSTGGRWPDYIISGVWLHS